MGASMTAVNIDIGYTKENPMYENFSLEIEPGNVINIAGENGSGKSTFYKTLIGEIPPLKGNIPSELRERIAIISDYINIPNEISVLDLMEFIGEGVEQVKKNYSDVYNIVESFKSTRVKHLSSGQRRILEIFSLLSSGKTVVILDEACNALDFKNKDIFLEQVKLLSKSGVTVFNTSHNLEDLMTLGGRIFVLSKNSKSIVLYDGIQTVEALNSFIRTC